MALRRQPAGEGFEVVERIGQFRLGERVDRQRGQFVVGGAKRSNRGLHRLRTHNSNICASSKKISEVFLKSSMRGCHCAESVVKQRIQSSRSTSNGAVGTSAMAIFAAESVGITSPRSAASAALVPTSRPACSLSSQRTSRRSQYA